MENLNNGAEIKQTNQEPRAFVVGKEQQESDLLSVFQNHKHTGVDGSPRLGTNKIYAGSVDASGNAIGDLPEGWVSENVSSNEYKITHNLGTTRYVVSLTAEGVIVYIKSSGKVKASLSYLVESVGGGAITAKVDFMIIMLE